MRKKLFTAFLYVLIAFSAITFSACSNPYFSGDYETTTKEEVETFASGISEIPESTQIDWEDGYSVNFKLSGNLGGGDVRVELSYLAGIVNDSFAVAGNIDMQDVEDKIKGEIYYNNGYTYINGNVGSVNGPTTNGKFKESSSYEDFINEYGISMVLIENIANVLPYLATYEKINFFVEDGEETLKIKIEIPNQKITQEGSGFTRIMEGKGTYVFVYGTNNKLIGFHADTSSKTTMQTQQGSSNSYMNLKIDITPYEGEIVLPTDFDSYVED